MELFGWPARNPVLYLLSGHSSALVLCPNSPDLAHFLSLHPHHRLTTCYSICLKNCPSNSLIHSPTQNLVCLEDTICLSGFIANLYSGKPLLPSTLQQASSSSALSTDCFVYKSTLNLLFIIICSHGSHSSSTLSFF